MTPAQIQLEDAMLHCRDITRRKARNFYHGLKLLPPAKRDALFAVYAWMRLADDLADEADDDRERAMDRIESLRSRTASALNGDAMDDDPVLIALADVAQRYPLEEAHFNASLDGQLDDLSDRQYDTFEQLHEYCYRVASSVGLICLSIWGCSDRRGRAGSLGVDRGVALQLTNILRDLKEDHERGRCYLPREELSEHGLTIDELVNWRKPAACMQLLQMQFDRAESYYQQSSALDGMIESDCRPTLWAMTEIYHRLLHRMRQEPQRIVIGPRVRLSGMRKILIALHAKRRARG
jgi:phytoene synthase